MGTASSPASGWRIDEGVRARTIAAHDVESLRDHAQLTGITDFAAALCEAPTALVSLVEERRQTFLARTGLDASETPRETSFCAHAMLGDRIMIVPDARADPRFADNPLVTGAPFIRFYAGAPLVADDGVPLGSLCVIDSTPRDGLTPLQRQGLATLAEAVMARLRDSRDAASWRAAEADAKTALNLSEDRFRVLADAMPQMVWSTRPDGYHDYFNARWYEFTGMARGATDGEAWNEVFHPDDRARADAVWRHSLATGEPYQVEYRLRHQRGDYRWALGRALPLRDDAGVIVRWFGTCTDVHEQKLASEEREVIAQELSHRIKNIFSVVAGLVAFTARARPGFAEIADDLRARIHALGRAHDFVRPHSARSRPVAIPNTLHGLLDELFRPYQGVTPRITVSGEDIAVDDRSATPLALLFHELATNATKYGALLRDDGRVAVEIVCRDDAVILCWTETGGPTVPAPGAHKGFGTQLIELSAIRQLGGKVDRDWRPEGLKMTVRIPAAALNRR